MWRRLLFVVVGVLIVNFPTSTAQNRQYRVTVPKLDGGVNTNEALNLVADNQLTDGNNVWFKDGALRTRPGLWTGENETTGLYMHKSGNEGSVVSMHPTDYGTYVAEYSEVYNSPNGYSNASFGVMNNNGEFASLGFGHIKSSIGTPNPPHFSFMFASTNSTVSTALSQYGALLFISNDKIYGANNGMADNLTDKYYVPLVLVNGYPSVDLTNLSVNGTFFEGFNLLTPKFKCTYTSDNNGIYYALPYKGIDNAEIKVSRIQTTGAVVNYTIPAGANASSVQSGTYANINRAGGYFWFGNSSNTPVKLVEDGIRNNITIEASYSQKHDASLICGMTINTWFGGDRSGLNGGTRLFVSGNPQHPNLVNWSDVNNPLYFPENNSACLGSDSQKVTGFGKQSDMLVIFKERETYYTNYVAGLSYTAEDVMSGRVTDVTTNAAVFPITPINANIGCDVPNTVQLCANKLVWMNSDGKVYTLVSTNQWSERNIRELGQNISAKISEHDVYDRRGASAADYDGHYYLLIGNRVYVMDYEDGSFQYYAGYQNDKKVQRGIAWYVWDVSLDNVTWHRIVGNVGNAILCGKQTIGDSTYLINYVFKGSVDYNVNLSAETAETKPIPCMVQSKVFDFGSPERIKDVQNMYIGIGSDAGEYGIRTTYLTNYGEIPDAYEIVQDVGAAGNRSADYVKERWITPSLKRITRFGVRFESNGSMAVDNLVIVYSLYGGSVR